MKNVIWLVITLQVASAKLKERYCLFKVEKKVKRVHVKTGKCRSNGKYVQNT